VTIGTKQRAWNCSKREKKKKTEEERKRRDMKEGKGEFEKGKKKGNCILHWSV